MVEKESLAPAEIKVEEKEESISQGADPVSGTLPQTLDFLHDAIKHQAYKRLDVRKRNLIGIYYGTEAGLSDLRDIARVTSRQRVRQLITMGMEKMWQNLPKELQEKHPLETVIKSKKNVTAKTRKRMSEALKGRVSPMKGRAHSAETRRRMSEAHKGSTHSAETRRRMSETRKGRVHSAETRRRMSEALKQKWQDPEHRKRMSETRSRY